MRCRCVAEESTATSPDAARLHSLPEKPTADNCGLLSINSGLFWGILANYLGQLGFPG